MVTSYQDSNTKSWDLPDAFAADDVRMSEHVIERYIREYTAPGDLVFDPFAGFGTVMVVAEKLGRRSIGFEIDEGRAAYANALLAEGSEVVATDARDTRAGFPQADLCVSSPPYMNRGDEENPLSGYTTPVSAYHEYISEMASIYTRVGQNLTANGRLVIQVQNLKNARGYTALAFDLYAAIGHGLQFVGEEVTVWTDERYGYTHGYCLMYRRI